MASAGAQSPDQGPAIGDRSPDQGRRAEWQALGRQINASTAEYNEEHLRRLRLVRAMIQVGRIPVATVREVLRHVDDDSLGRSLRLGAAMWALPQVPEPEQTDEYIRSTRQEVDDLLTRLGYADSADILLPYAELMQQMAVLDLDFMETHPSKTEQVETAVLGTVLMDPALTALHRLAQEEETARRYGLAEEHTSD